MSNETLMLIAESAVMIAVIQLAVIVGLLGMVKDLKASSRVNSRLLIALVRKAHKM